MAININLFKLIYGFSGHSIFLDNFFVFITGHFTYAVVVLALVYCVCLFPFLVSDPIERLRRIGQGAQVVLSVFVTSVIVWILKVLVAEPRPFVALSGVKSLVEETPFESFPSAHSALTMAVALAVFPHHKKLGIALFIFSIIVGFSRIYVGVHYPIDVLVGFLIGFGVVFLIQRVFAQNSKKG